jgi:hypothetical protein
MASISQRKGKKTRDEMLGWLYEKIYRGRSKKETKYSREESSVLSPAWVVVLEGVSFRDGDHHHHTFSPSNRILLYSLLVVVLYPVAKRMWMEREGAH